MSDHDSDFQAVDVEPGGSADPVVVDVLEYMLNAPGQTVQDARTRDMQQTRHHPDERAFWYLKHPDLGYQWEEYHYDDEKVWLSRDTTSPPGDGPGTAYDVWEPDGMWFPRFWMLGLETKFSILIFYFKHRDVECPYVEPPRPWRHGRHLLR